MTAPRSLVIGLTVVVSTAIVGVLTTSMRADAQDQRPATPVDIVNSIPLNVSGNIALTPGGTVNIGNSADSPVPVFDVMTVAKEPFQVGTVATSFSSSSSSADIVTVPAGKRLVIEHFSAWINASGPDGLAAITMGPASGPFDQPLCVPVGKTGNGLNHFFQCSSSTKFFVAAGQTLRFFVSVANSDGGFHRAFVSGYYEPVP